MTPTRSLTRVFFHSRPPSIRAFDASNEVSERSLGVSGKLCAITAPIAKAAPEAMHASVVDFRRPMQERFERTVAELRLGLALEDMSLITELIARGSENVEPQHR
jgi:hypothetical protein